MKQVELGQCCYQPIICLLSAFPKLDWNYCSRGEMTLFSSPNSYPIFGYGFQFLLEGCSSALYISNSNQVHHKFCLIQKRALRHRGEKRMALWKDTIKALIRNMLDWRGMEEKKLLLRFLMWRTILSCLLPVFSWLCEVSHYWHACHTMTGI